MIKILLCNLNFIIKIDTHANYIKFKNMLKDLFNNLSRIITVDRIERDRKHLKNLIGKCDDICCY